MKHAMNVVHALQPFPDKVISSIFLAGPTARDAKVKGWRPEALEFLVAAGYGGTVFVPEHEGWKPGLDPKDWTAQVEWEEEALNRADCILFWIPRNMKALPGLTTNDEWGRWKDSGKCVLGTPEGAMHVGYQRFYAERLAVPLCSTLAETVAVALKMVGVGEARAGGEAQVPLPIWQHPTFRAWYATQREAGNRLDGARVLWTFRVGPGRARVFSWVVHVDVYVAIEGRNKVNEFVLGRTDVSSVVMWRRPNALEDDPFLDIEIVLVKEFRSPARNASGFVYELPGGSAAEPGADDDRDLAVAAEEVHQETGLAINASRFRRQGVRQPAATLSAHTASLFSVELTAKEMERLREDAISGVPHGVAADTERTYVDISTLRIAIETGFVDWTTIGQIMAALSRPEGGP